MKTTKIKKSLLNILQQNNYRSKIKTFPTRDISSLVGLFRFVFFTKMLMSTGVEKTDLIFYL